MSHTTRQTGSLSKGQWRETHRYWTPSLPPTSAFQFHCLQIILTQQNQAGSHRTLIHIASDRTHKRCAAFYVGLCHPRNGMKTTVPFTTVKPTTKRWIASWNTNMESKYTQGGVVELYLHPREKWQVHLVRKTWGHPACHHNFPPWHLL